MLDSLLTAGEVVKDALQVEFETGIASHLGPDPPSDPDILEPYKRATALAKEDGPVAAAIAADLQVMEKRIDELRSRYLSQIGKTKKNDPQLPWERKNDRKKGPARMTDNPMLPIIRDFRQPIAGIQWLDSLGNIDEIKASHAFGRTPAFAFSMAFQDICEIKRKAEMKRGPRNRVAFIDDAKNMGGAARRLLKHLGD